ncbi:MAG: S10 family peptidase [Acidobacteriota bacterium]
MKRSLIGLAAALVLSCAVAARAQEKPPEKPAEKPPAETAKKEPPRAEQSVTQHSVVIGGATVNYTATAGTLVLKNDKDEPWASMGYTAYVRRDAGNPSRRPITFAYNGGPGSSSVWLHMGALGPRRIVTTDAGATPPPPYQLVDNAYSILDKSDLVMIDPVGTGYSKAVGEAKNKDFWGVDPDIQSVSRFIKQYVSDNGRWNSPKYLLGESYGSTRSGGIADYLQTKEGMSLNGVVLVSVALDIEALFAVPGNDRPYPFFLPTYTATSWYHKVLPSQPKELDPLLDEVRRYALGPYTEALMKGDTLSDADRRAVAEKLHQYTGLSVDYVLKANLRVSEGEYAQELLREHGETVGRLDSRFLGVTLDRLAKEAEYDPQEAAISAAFTAAFNNYYNEELKFGQGKTYAIEAEELFKFWEWKHKPPGSPFPIPGFPNTGLDLAHAMTVNPNLHVLVLNGTFDLATPFLATEYMMSHLGLEKKLQGHIHMKYYPAGHMMYVHEQSLKAFKADVAAFLDATDRL